MALLIDTSLLVAFERDDVAMETLGDEERAMSVVTVSELLHGVLRARGPKQTRRRAVVEAILAAFDAIPVTEPVRESTQKSGPGSRRVAPSLATTTSGLQRLH